MIQNEFSDYSPLYITDSEREELQEFLLSDDLPEGTMTIDTLEGFFTALIISPVTTHPKAWFPLVWDMSGGGEAAKFESLEQAKRITELLTKMMTSIVVMLTNSPDDYVPLSDTIRYESDEIRDSYNKLWATGFMIGVSHNQAEWEPIFSDETASALLSAISALSVRPDDSVQLPTKKFRAFWEIVPDCVRALNEYWCPVRCSETERVKGMLLGTQSEKVGRNEPCACGSGKKFKKCCGK